MSKAQKLEILAPEKAGSLVETVSNWKQCFHKATPSDVAAGIKRDMEESERFGRASVYGAITIGLRLIFIRDNGPRGTLQDFIEDHFDGTTRRTLGNHMRAAQGFLNASGILDKRTHRLRDGAALAPIFETQLHLFMSPEAERFDGILKKLTKYVGDRSLRDLLKIMQEADSSPPKNYGNAGGANKPSPQKRARADAMETLDQIQAFMASKEWVFLDEGDLARLDNLLAEFHAQVGAHIKEQTRKGGAR